MRCECPTFRRCCLCIPLRFGLLGTGFTKIMLNIIFVIYFSSHIRRIRSDTPRIIQATLIITVTFLCVDVIFNLLLLYGCFKKDSVKLRVFYRYSLFVLFTNIAWVITLIIMDLVIAFISPFLWIFTLYPVVISALFFILGIFLNTYFTILVRSEVVKLEDNTQFQFTNFAGGVCAMTATAVVGDVESGAVEVENVQQQ